MRSIAAKLNLAFLLVGLTGAVLVAVILQVRTRNAFNQFILSREQQVLAESLTQYYQQNGGWGDVANNLQALVGSPVQFAPGNPYPRRGLAPFTLVGTDRKVIFSSDRDRAAGQQLANRDLQRAFALKVNGETVGWLIPASIPRVLIPNSPEEIFLRTINSATLVSALVAAVLALILGGLLAYTLTGTLRELTEATLDIARGKFGRQVKIRSRDELGELAASFNRMSLELAQATDLRKQMTADIAHDLRTPLSVISGYAEALSDGKLSGTPEVYTVLHAETQHLSRLIDDLRTLSLVDAGELPLNLQPISPRALLERVARRHAVAAQQKGISIRVEAGQDPPAVSVDPERMVQVFDNLVSNAFRYTPAGGEVILRARAADGTVELQVQDTGSGIAPENLPHVFDRFYRGDPARTQNGELGLGLAIGKSIVEAHGGTIAAASQPGQGAAFTITLPSSPAQ